MSNAAERGHKEIFELLLTRNDININERTSGFSGQSGVGALSNAAQEGHTEMVELLLARNNIDVNAGKLSGMPAHQYKGFVQIMTSTLMQVHH